ncbi:vomeronasal type-2 receptor 26-like [Pituophis catenifer annectens]|uniref:vomeronasal type-2 receptor 26-like n=1 Tax=Pituophis catenifer annectens TaxID=94852 RepID=UPI00399282C8
MPDITPSSLAFNIESPYWSATRKMWNHMQDWGEDYKTEAAKGELGTPTNDDDSETDSDSDTDERVSHTEEPLLIPVEVRVPSTGTHTQLFLIQNYQHILALEFALKEINENPHLLPNITLGFHIYNSNFIGSWTYRGALELLSTKDKFIPNYKCDGQNNEVAVIGGPYTKIFLDMANILCNYKVQQTLKDFWEGAFQCAFPNSSGEKNFDGLCTGEEKIETLPSSIFDMNMNSHSYTIYNAVYAVVHALRALYSFKRKHKVLPDKSQLNLLQQGSWKLHHFLRTVSFNNNAGEPVSFDESGQLVSGFDIINWITLPNQSLLRVKVGSLDVHTSEAMKFTIQEKAIVWPTSFNQVQPLSVCNDHCLSGHRKTMKEEKLFCCYDCLPCAEEKISAQEDADDCVPCPGDQYANFYQNACIVKEISFLSYQDILGITSLVFAFSLAFMTVLVLAIFIKHNDTPIVKANNQSLSYLLLTSLLFSFLSAFLFIGRPTVLACLLQQVAFSFIFSVAISCVLAKTIIVVLAFMATKPGSEIRKWAGNRLATSIVFSCSFIQASLCVIWLATSAPFPNFDMYSLHKEIILECNEGSTYMFYCVLGFMNILALVSFMVAYLARNLPDTFNEAKFITFSMLIVCSVWLSFFPAYLSTKGKHMVAVEIFSIFGSSAGLLACIFLPKCYIILFQPELNKREQLVRR